MSSYDQARASNAAKKAWETRRRRGWTPKGKKASAGSDSSSYSPRDSWYDAYRSGSTKDQNERNAREAREQSRREYEQAQRERAERERQRERAEQRARERAANDSLNSLLGRSRAYKTLGLDSSATPVDIKKAFRALALKFHPDRATNDEERVAFAARFTEISSAYTLLVGPNSTGTH